MRIDLFYYTPYLNNYYFVYGPEKDSNGDIYIKPTGYYFADANDMVAKLRSMADSLAPEITNVQARNQGNSFWIYVGDLNTGSSDVPDYTQILTRIANALDTDTQDNVVNKLQSLLEKFTYSNHSVAQCLESLFLCFNQTGIESTASQKRENSFIKSLNDKFSYSGYSIADIMRKFFMSVVANCSLETLDINLQRNSVGTILQKILAALSGSYQAGSSSADSNIYSYIKQISQNLKQSVSPNANITDVISALNTTIDSKQDTTIVNNEVTPLAEINIDVPFEVKNLKKSDVENL